MERLLSVANDIEVLNAKLREIRLGKIGEPSERSVGHPRKALETTLLKVREDTPTKKLKVCGTFKNRGTPLLWVHIDVVVKRHGNLTNALHYLEVA